VLATVTASNILARREILSVRCNHCGAPLEVGTQTRFVTCQFCRSQLEVKHTDSAAFTEVVQQIAESTKRMAGNLKVIELQNELERLDREWEMKKELYYVSGKYGSRSRPSPVGAVMVGIIGLVFMSFWISTTSSIGAPSFFPIFGVIGICILIFNVVSNLNKAESLKRAEETYEHQRTSLLAQIDSARKH
jgi:uncharacterized Zn finger protein (UPF0148 family)